MKQSHLFYRLDFAMRTGEETDASHVPKLSLDLLKPQEAADERDPVLKRLSSCPRPPNSQPN